MLVVAGGMHALAWTAAPVAKDAQKAVAFPVVTPAVIVTIRSLLRLAWVMRPFVPSAMR
jgi:hypothetical protein